MHSNSGPWPWFPTQYTGYPSYYPGVSHTTGTTDIPRPVPTSSDPGSSSNSTRLTAGAKEFMPAGTVGSGPLDPSPGFPLPKKKVIRISNPATGEEIIPKPPDRAARPRAGNIYVSMESKPIRITRPAPSGHGTMTKKERKRLAKLEAEAKKRRGDEEKKRLGKEAEEKALEGKMKAKVDEQFTKAWEEVERWKREGERLKSEEEERRRKIKEDPRIQREKIKDEQELKQREEAEAKAKAEEEERLRRLAEEFDEKWAAEVKELMKKKEVSRLFSFGSPTTSTSSAASPSLSPQIPDGFGFYSTQRSLITSNLSRDWALVSRIVDLSRVTYPKGIKPPSTELDNGQMPGGKYKHVYDRVFLLQFTALCKEAPDYASNLDGLGVKRQEKLFVHNPLYELSGRAKGRIMGAMDVPSSSISTGVGVGRGLTSLPGRNPFLPLNSERGPTLKTGEERPKASTNQLKGTSRFQSASSSPRTQDTPSRPLNHDPPIAPAGPKDQGALQPDLAEDEENTKGAAVEVRNDHVTINAISELSKQMEQLLREMRDLKDEVRELRSLTQREAKKERGKVRTPPGGSLEGGTPKAEPSLESPYREISAPQAKPRTATAVNPYFIMKDGELDFVQGDVITLLDSPQDTPSPRGPGWLHGEVIVTKRGFFPASYVKLQK